MKVQTLTNCLCNLNKKTDYLKDGLINNSIYSLPKYPCLTP